MDQAYRQGINVDARRTMEAEDSECRDYGNGRGRCKDCSCRPLYRIVHRRAHLDEERGGK